MDFLEGLGALPAAPSTHRDEARLEVDAGRRLAAWNAGAEECLGWSADEVIGKPATATLVAPRQREMFERVLDACFEGSLESSPGSPVELLALHRDGREVSLEVRLTRLGEPPAPVVVALFRDITERRRLEKLLELNDTLDAATMAGSPPDQLLPGFLEQLGSTFGWSAGAFWRIDLPSGNLRCETFWRTPTLAGAELERLAQGARCAPGEGIPGSVWADDRPRWVPDLSDRVGTRLEAAALDAGLTAVAAVPVRVGREIVGVLEFFAASAADAGAARMAHLESFGLRLGRYLRGSPPTARRRKRYKLETRSTHLAFSCAFMKFLTVHGTFRDFSGWVEVDHDDARTTRAECTIRTDSVDTRSLERDFHLRSADFFAAERFPTMTFRSTTVETLGDEHFRVFGDLTVRDVTRPIRLEGRLEDREVDGAGNERMTFSAGAVINRLDWFLDWERALQAGRWIVGNEVRLDLVITLVHRPEIALGPRR